MESILHFSRKARSTNDSVKKRREQDDMDGLKKVSLRPLDRLILTPCLLLNTGYSEGKDQSGILGERTSEGRDVRRPSLAAEIDGRLIGFIQGISELLVRWIGKI